MRRSTFRLLSTAFTLAVAGCKKEPLPPPPPPAPTPVASASASAATTTTTRIGPTVRRYNQWCVGAIVPKLTPGKAVDYLEMRVESKGGQGREIYIAGSQGEACKQAKDAQACKTKLDEATSKHRSEFLVYTRGDDVGVVAGKEVGAFLAPIESAEDAAFTLTSSAAADNQYPPCEPKNYKQTDEGWQLVDEQHHVCNEKDVITYLVTTAGEAQIVDRKHTPRTPGCVPMGKGRRPEGFALDAHPDRETLGGHFAESAELEAASVDAFLRLEDELRRMGAPDSLRRRARRSAEDEQRHTQAMSALAARFGGAPRRLVVEASPARSIVAMAIENAVEGCVFETWAALVATFQAEHAGDAEVRAAIKAIARDETRHAALAWDVAAYLETRLDRSQVERVSAARRAAFARLEIMIAEEPSDDLRRVAGLPTAREARALFEQLLQIVDDAAAAAA